MPADSSLSALLTEYAQDPSRSLEEVALKLQLAPAHATRLMKKYAYLMQLAVEDKDFPTRAATRMGVSNEIAMALEPQIDNFADVRVTNELKNKRGQRNMTQVVDSAMQRDERLLEQDFSRDVPLSGSNPVRLLRWVVSDLMRHKLDQQTATSFLHLFATDPEYFMNQPMKLEQKMKDLFGNNDGDKAFRQFYELVTTKLGPSQQFGGPAWQVGSTGPWGGPPQSSFLPPQQGVYQPSAPQYAGTNSYLNWYQAKGVIPRDVDPNSPEAKRAIEEYEMDKRDRRRNDELNNMAKRNMEQQMIRMSDMASMGGGGGQGGGMNMNNMMPYIMSGMFRMVQRINPQTGQPESVIERNVGPMPGQNGMVADGQPNTEVSIIDAATKLMGVLQQNNQVTQMFQPLITKALEKSMGLAENGGTSGLVQTASDIKQLAEVLGVNNNAQFNIESRRLDLAEKRIDSDREVAMQQLNQTRGREDKATDWEHKQEEMSQTRMNGIIEKFGPGILDLVKPIIATVVESKLGGGAAGAGGGGMPPGMPPGQGGMPPGMEQGPAYVNDPGAPTTPNEQVSPTIPGSTPVSNEDLGGYGAGAAGMAGGGMGGGGGVPASTYNEYAAGPGGPNYAFRTELERQAEIEAQRQADMARRQAALANQRRNDAWAEVGRNLQTNSGVRQYDPNEFMNYTPEQLEQAEAQAKGLVDSAHSLSDAVRTARHNRMLSGMSSQPPQPQQPPYRGAPQQVTGQYQGEIDESIGGQTQGIPSNYDPNDPNTYRQPTPPPDVRPRAQYDPNETKTIAQDVPATVEDIPPEEEIPSEEEGEYVEENTDYVDAGDIGE